MARHFVRRCRWAHAPTTHAASHVDYEKIVVSASIFMHGCDPVPKLMVLRLGALRYQCGAYHVNHENYERSSYALKARERNPVQGIHT